MDNEMIRDRGRGALVGGAAGDALGYEVEFMDLGSIRKRFGVRGISRYVLHNGVARFSDDTQMTLFTAEGLLNSTVGKETVKLGDAVEGIRKAYLNWYKTQTESPRPSDDSWLSHLRPLWARRAPGLTCLGSLETIARRRDVQNSSKGCGGVMRVAPIGIFFAARLEITIEGEMSPIEATVKLASDAAYITHGHMSSNYSSGLLAAIVYRCIVNETPVDRTQFKAIVEKSLSDVQKYLPSNRCWDGFKELITKAMRLAESNVSDGEAILQLGEGWVGDEAIAIAIFSVMRYLDSFEDCLVCAVNHDGDSDSTGAIAGNIIGSILGYSAIPSHFLENLELEPVLLSVADDLSADTAIPADASRLEARYVCYLPSEVDPKYILKCI